MPRKQNLIGKPVYNSSGWILGLCVECGRANYVEPHGTSAKCACRTRGNKHDATGRSWTEHKPIPFDCRDMSGTHVTRNPA